MKLTEKGFTVVEVVLAAAVFVIVSVGVVGVTLQGLQNNRLAQEETKATQFLSEGLEAAHSIRNRSFSLLTNTLSTGVASSSGFWNFAGTNNTFEGKFTRVISIANAQRNSVGNIVDTGGTGDPYTKKITVTVTWNVTPGRNNTISQVQYLSDWRRSLNIDRGMLVYGNGGTTTDSIQYQIYDGSAGTWSGAASVADIDGGSSNRAARIVKVYSSTTRNEKVLVSRHYDGTNQYIYAQVYNGASNTWGNVQLLSSWVAGTFLDAQNFDAAYLNSGNLMVVFSDNTTIPKMRTWNGTTWSAQSSLTDPGGGDIPLYVDIAARPGTNEVMATFYCQNRDTDSQYWSGSTWSANTSHATNGSKTNTRLVAFEWSPNSPLKGMIVYTTANNDNNLSAKVWTANGTGGGSFGAAANSANQTSNVNSFHPLTARSGADEFHICDTDDNAPDRIVCWKLTFSGTTSTWTAPTNQTLVTGTPNGIYTTFGLGFEANSGDPAINVYSDNTSTPKFNKFTSSTATWDASPTSITTNGTPGTFHTARVIPNPNTGTNDMMVLMADANQDVFSIVWDGSNNAMFTTPAAKAYLAHGTTGSATGEYWYDFAWDGM